MNEITDKSAILQIFEDIKSRILLKVPEVSEVVIYNDQMDNERRERPFIYPYVSVSISVDWESSKGSGVIPIGTGSNLVSNFQDGKARIIIYCCFEDLKDETQSFLETEPIRHSVYRALQGMQNEDYYLPLDRVSSPSNTNHDRVYALETIFETQLTESALVYESTEQTLTTLTDIGVSTDLDIDNFDIRTGNGK